MHRRNTSLYLVIAGLALMGASAAAFILLPRGVSGTGTKSEITTIPAKVDYPAPEISLTGLDGSPVSLADFKGQVVLVNLWATWCPPCKKEMPILQSYYDGLKDQGFVIVAINDGDPEADVVEFVREYGLTFPVWLDPQYIATEKAFLAPNLPSSFVIDRQGTIRLRWVGEITSSTLEKYVTPIITE